MTYGEAQEVAMQRALESWHREHKVPTSLFGRDFVSLALSLPRPEFLARVYLVEEPTKP